jgi:hypothetical protein
MTPSEMAKKSRKALAKKRGIRTKKQWSEYMSKVRRQALDKGE